MKCEATAGAARELGEWRETWRYKLERGGHVCPRERALDPLRDVSSVLSMAAGEHLGEWSADPLAGKREICAGPWRDREPAAYGDCRALLIALRAKSRCPNFHERQHVFLVDNLGLALAIANGRCASYILLQVCRPWAALALVFGSRASVRCLWSTTSPTSRPPLGKSGTSRRKERPQPPAGVSGTSRREGRPEP